MAAVIIAVRYDMPELLKRLEKSMFFFEKDEAVINLKELNIDGWSHVSCKLSGNAVSADSGALFRQCLSHVLTEFITRCQHVFYLSQILCRHYFYFSQKEREEILRLAVDNYNNQVESDKRIEICGDIGELVYQCLEKKDYINLHGFIIFRLQEWLNCLRRNVDQAVDDFLMEKEYQEFVRLLKYFVEIQQPKINYVHVILDSGGDIQLLDQNYEQIEHIGMEWEHIRDEGEQDDHLVSMLITAAPHKVVLHRQVYTHYPKAAETIKNVFENRVSFCKRCKLCQDISTHIHLKE